MQEKHFAYKIIHESSGLVCSHQEFEEERMLDLLENIKSSESKGIYWIFKQFDGQPQEAMSIIDCENQRIYFHYSGEVEPLDVVIQKLKR